MRVLSSYWLIELYELYIVSNLIYEPVTYFFINP